MNYRNSYAYACETYPKIRQWCKDNGIKTYDEMIVSLAENSPDPAWTILFESSPSAQMRFMDWFSRQAYTEARKTARQQHRGNDPNDRRPVPCICRWNADL